MTDAYAPPLLEDGVTARLAAALPGSWPPVADRLGERADVTTAGVLEAYALCEPEEGWWRVLCAWLGWVGDTRRGGVARLEIVEYDGGGVAGWYVGPPQQRAWPLPALHLTPARAGAARRRRVLALFDGDVRYRRQCAVPLELWIDPGRGWPDIDARLRAAGFAGQPYRVYPPGDPTAPDDAIRSRVNEPHRLVEFYQNLTPSQLLPPDSGWATADSTPLDDLRALTRAMEPDAPPHLPLLGPLSPRGRRR